MRIPDDKVNEWFPYVEEAIRKDAANLVKYENGFILHQWHGCNVKIKGETKHDGEILSLTGWQRGQMLKKVLTRPFTLHVKRTWFDRVSTFLFVQTPAQYLDESPLVIESRVSTPPPPPAEQPSALFIPRLEV